MNPDDHAMIITSTKVLSPSGTVLVNKPVDSVDKLLKVSEPPDSCIAGPWPCSCRRWQ